MKTIRVTLDISLRPLTKGELAEACIEDLPEDCRPAGDNEDLGEIDPEDFADMARYAIESAEDMWGGSNYYAAVETVAVVDAAQVS